MFDDFEDFEEMTYEEECEMMDRHYATCQKAKRDEYCKVCSEY